MTHKVAPEASLKLPKAARMILVESTGDRLEIRSRSEFSWLYLVVMIFLVGAFVGSEISGKSHVPSGAIAFASILVVVFTAFLAFQSTYQWLRVRDGSIDYQLRLWGLPLTRKRAALVDIRKLASNSVETDSGGSSFAVITTPRWEVCFGLGCETDSTAIDALLDELKRIQRAQRGAGGRESSGS